MAKVAYERPRYEWYVVYAGVFLLLVGTTVFSYFTPGLIWVLDPVGVWAWLAFTIIFGGLGFLGMISWFRHRTPKMLTPNQVFQESSKAEINVPTDATPVSAALVHQELKTMSDREEADLKLAKELTPGYNQAKEAVAQAVRPLGGILAGGFQADPGDEGYLQHFSYQLIELNESTFCPYDIEAADHTQIESAALAACLVHKKFIPNKSPWFRTLDLNPNVQKWIRHDPDVHATVLLELGLPAIAESLVRHVVTQLRAHPEFQQVGADGRNGSTLPALTNAQVQILSKVAENWLRQEPRIKLTLDGWADKSYFRTRFYGTLSDNNYLRVGRYENLDTIREYDRTLHGRVSRDARVTSGAPGQGPTYDELGRRPTDPTRQ